MEDRSSLALELLPDLKLSSLRLGRREITPFVQSLVQHGPSRERFPYLTGEFLYGGVGRVRLQEQVFAIDPANFPSSRTPAGQVSARAPFPAPRSGARWRLA